MKLTLRLIGTAAALLTLPALSAQPVQAAVRVLAATDNLAWITQQIGGNHVSVDYLARGDQDPHMIEPRPSQVAKLARADLLVRIGMDLDLWMDSLLDAARNPKIARGSRGYVDAHVGLHPLEIPSGKLDPSMGDIHVYGNPHYEFSPEVVRTIVGRNILAGLERVDPGNAATYRANYTAFSNQLLEDEKRWKAKLAPFRGRAVVTYHKTFPYMLEYFGLREFANVEPKPGIAPSASHVAQVAQEMKRSGVKVIIAESYRPRRFSDLLAQESGGKVVPIPGGVGGERGIDSYFALMDTIVNRIAAAFA
jgi:zinc/manganese transport system substrate-binding protein